MSLDVFLSRTVLTMMSWLVVVQLGLADPPDGLEAIGGRWYVQRGEPNIYFYKDCDRYLDLFSYHTQDSNKDGIPNIKISHDSRNLLIQSQGYPNHPTAVFPNSGNPNTIRVQNFSFKFPLEPQLADAITRVPMGPIGMALNGVVFFNPYEMGGMNAVDGYSEVWLDSCCGHPQQTGVYHYHKYPICVKSPFKDDGKQHSPIIGFAFDGFPLFGPYEDAGVMAKDLVGDRALDVCNGHSDAERGYHYHVTPRRFPYILGGYAGVVEPSNNRELNRKQVGALVDNTQDGENHLSKALVAVRPGTLNKSGKHSIQIELDPTRDRRPIPDGKPSWVQIGPFEAKQDSIERNGNVILVEIDIPGDAPEGVLFDCHIEFDTPGGRGPTVYKRNDAFRIVE